MQLWSSKHASQQYACYTVIKNIVKGIYTEAHIPVYQLLEK